MEDKRKKIHVHEEKDCIFDSRFKGGVGEHNGHCAKDNAEFSYQTLFQKKLSPTDVEIRLVIPKKYATKYFSQIQQNEEVAFFDTSKKLWKFRYFYCESSQKCTFTTGWRKFVKYKGLRAKDTIIFILCESKEETKENSNTFVIDVVKNIEVLPMDLALNNHQQEEMIDEHEEETKEFTRAQPIDQAAAALTPILLFGKQIGWSETKKANGG